VKKVVFLNNWGESSQNLLKRYSIQTPLNSGKWKNIVGIDSIEKADYYVVMDGVREQVLNKLNWEKIIYLQREPKNIKPPFKNHNFPNNLFLYTLPLIFLSYHPSPFHTISSFFNTLLTTSSSSMYGIPFLFAM